MRILVVEDDATNRLVLKGLLAKEGHEVLMAENGKEAIDTFRQEQLDLILMDVMMPVMDGYEATRIIKSESAEKFIPIIFLTAMGGDETLVNCLENGGDDFLNKPVNRSVLVAKIKAMNRIRVLNKTVSEQHHELSLYRDWVETEQEVAEKIFSNIIKRGDDEIPIIHKYRKSADSFNGDIVLTVKNPSRGINILVGDFTGHGLAAAIGAIPVAEIFYAMSKKDWQIGDIVSEINRKISAFLPKGRFLAACVMQIDAQCQRLTVWNGGMPELIVTAKGAKEVKQYIASSHLPLGVFTPAQFDSTVEYVRVENDDRILMFSDGVTETENDDGEMFGMDRLEQTLFNSKEANRLDSIVEALTEFRGKAAQNDDITLVELVCNSSELDKMPDTGYTDVIKREAKDCAIEYVFRNETLKYYDPIPMLVESVKNMGVDIIENEDLFVIFSELYNNSLDHGVLGLSSVIKDSSEGFGEYYIERSKKLETLESEWIKIDIEFRKIADTNKLFVTICDSGKGFDLSEVEKDANSDKLRPRGRGFMLLNSLCEDMSYLKESNELKVIYSWK